VSPVLYGNLTVFADELNLVASSNPFLAKHRAYAKSNIPLTRDITGWTQFKFRQKEDRSKAFAKQTVAMWKV
jgi:hypothetical protein